jgi:hypothetical protein
MNSRKGLSSSLGDFRIECRMNEKRENILYVVIITKMAVVRERTIFRPSDRRFSAKLVLTLADGGCRLIGATDPYGRILGFLDRSRYCFFQVAPKLYSRG